MVYTKAPCGYLKSDLSPEQDGTWWRVRDPFTGCRGEGPTVPQAVGALRDALRAH